MLGRSDNHEDTGVGWTASLLDVVDRLVHDTHPLLALGLFDLSFSGFGFSLLVGPTMAMGCGGLNLPFRLSGGVMEELEIGSLG